MDEEVIVSPLENPFESQAYSRQKYYDEQSKQEKPPKLAMHIVSLLLFGLDGEIILQKRAGNKRHNPSLIDKTLGGHIKYGDTPDYTVMVETIQELLTPSVVLGNSNDFWKTLALLTPYLDTIAVNVKKIVRPWRLGKLVGGENHNIDNIVHLYFGVYGGRMRPADREAAGVLYYSSLEQLEQEIADHPDIFTDDIKQICAVYHDDILEFQREVRLSLQK